MTFLPSQSEAGFRPALADDFCCGGQGRRCSYECGVVPVVKGGSESGDALYFFVDVVHEKGEEGIR